MFTEQQKNAYLKRIGFEGTLDQSFATLKKIVEGHCFTFPYETLNVHDSVFDNDANHRSNLQTGALLKKLVDTRRGGRCVELNLSLQTMLKAFGFNINAIMPEMLWHNLDTPKAKRPKHSAAIATVEGKEYLIDAAFGPYGIMSPLLLKKGTYKQFSEKFKLTSSEEYPFELQIWHEKKWASIYGFDTLRVPNKAYRKVDEGNRDVFKAGSLFKELFLCCIPYKLPSNKNGRYYIRNDIFRIIEDGKQILKEKITSQQQFQEIMTKYFNINLNGHYIRFSPLDMKANLHGIHQPPILHAYNTRLKTKYVEFAQTLGVELTAVKLRGNRK